MATPVVFLPGSLCDERLFEHQREAIPNATVADLTGAQSIAEMAANVLAVAPDEFVLVGLSLGGIVAVEMARMAPSRTRGLALLVTTSTPHRQNNWPSEGVGRSRFAPANSQRSSPTKCFRS